MEHVRGSQDGLPLGIDLHVRTQDVAVPSQNLLSLGVPYDELLVGILHGVILIQVQRHARTASCLTEGNLAQTANFTHHLGRILPGDDIYLVVALVGKTQALVFGEFALQYLYRYGVYDLFHVDIELVDF